MEDQKEEQKGKAPDNEQYDVNNPQNLTQPQFNSTSTHREGAKVPAVENLNQNNDENNLKKEKESNNSETKEPVNDDSLNGTGSQTDLGDGQRDEDEADKERIIRR
ncbi:MAG: hypothetical protein ABWY16_09995 [Pedobacter sp.]|uniref:hypothetical protein n=1 Tax=Pedobacter sp. TaxID=1411316 RepID=UPI0033949630